MEKKEKFNVMYDFEIAINKLIRQLTDHTATCMQRNDRNSDSAYTAQKLAEGLTYTKLAISQLLDDSFNKKAVI